MKKENKNYIYKKEKNIFWSGILLGLATGIVGNALVSSAFSLINLGQNDELTRIISLTILIISTLAFVYLFKIINKNLNKLK